MRLFATIILAAFFCATASAQTLKSLMYNTTNGQVVYGSASALRFESENLQSVYFTDIFAQNIEAGIDTNSVAFGPLGIDFAGVAAANTRANLGFSTNLNTLWTATNASSARSAMGVGATNAVSFASVSANYAVVGGIVNNPATAFVASDGYSEETHYALGTIQWYSQYDLMGEINLVNQYFASPSLNSAWTFHNPIAFNNTTNAATTRTNLGIPLAALTNTSNVTAMRALAGSTNTNHPFSGTITIRDFNDDAHDIVVSNGIITSYTAP